ncbi:MAG: hypothetical protein ACPGNT_06565 [Rhodospirillales bacterium]
MVRLTPKAVRGGVLALASLGLLAACGEDKPLEPDLCAYALEQSLRTPSNFKVDRMATGGRKQDGRELVTIQVWASYDGGGAEASCTFDRQEKTTLLTTYFLDGRKIEGDAFIALTALVDRKKWELSMRR